MRIFRAALYSVAGISCLFAGLALFLTNTFSEIISSSKQIDKHFFKLSFIKRANFESDFYVHALGPRETCFLNFLKSA